MTKLKWIKLLAAIGLAALFFATVDDAHAQQFALGGGTFESKLGRLRDALTGTILPLVSTIGLVYAAILSMAGSGEGRTKIVGVVAMSIVGFMARYIIEFFQGITG